MTLNIEKLIMVCAVALIGMYALYLDKIEVTTACLGIMGGILTASKDKEVKREENIAVSYPVDNGSS